MRRVIVIGGGAAGLMAGVIAAKSGASTLILEKMNMVGKKMGITGKGRCNITNMASMDECIKNTPGNGKFLYSAYQQFTNQDLLALLHSWGLETKVERGGRVFPVSDSALDVRNAFLDTFKKYGGKLHLQEAVTAINVVDGVVVGVTTERSEYPCDAVVLATGGVSYPLTGSTGDGYELAAAHGHSIVEPRPSLVPLETKEGWVKSLMGLSLKNVEVSVWAKNKVQAKEFGEMMFTHFGVTGPIILSLSHTVTKLLKKGIEPIHLAINLKPALTEEQLDKRVQRDFQTYQNKSLVNGMKDLLPSRLIPLLCEYAGLDGNKPIHSVTKVERQALVKSLQELLLTVHRPRPIAEAIVTAGGIQVKEVNPKTMESKFIQGLYMAGETLDVDAFTGGYNLQAAFSMGYVAGIMAAQQEEE